MSITGSDMPPEVREIVDEAGAQQCLYYCDRWRQSTKPPVGQGAGEMPNTVPGSQIEATQGTASAQPIAHNRGFSFEGDDWLDLPELEGRAFPTEYTIAGLWDLPTLDSASVYFLSALYDPDNSSRIEIAYNNRSSSADEIQANMRANGTGVTAKVSISEPVGRVAIAAHYEIGSHVEIEVRDGASGGGSTTNSESPEDTTIASANIGGRLDGSNNIVGVCSEKLLARTIPPMGAEALADRIWWRHQ